MRKDGSIFCDACHLVITSHDPERVYRHGKDLHNACAEKMMVIVVIPARWKEANNGKHKARDCLH